MIELMKNKYQLHDAIQIKPVSFLSCFIKETGCFCNPGACSKHLGLSHLDLLSNFEAGHVCWDDSDILKGKPTGAIRISFGYMSTFEDAQKLIRFVVNSFVSMPSPAGNGCLSRVNSNPFSSKGVTLKSIAVYPIKSCAGFWVDRWPLSPTGLQHDREWLLKGPSGEVLTQKKVPEMCLISTFIDLTQGILFVESPRCELKLQINLESAPCYEAKEEIQLQSQRYEVQSYDSEVNLWFSTAIGHRCTLLRCFAPEYRHCMNKSGSIGMCRDVGSKLNFVNEGQFLLISEESISDLNSRLISNIQSDSHVQPIHVDPMRFRPNLVISGSEPYAEDEWRGLNIGKEHFTSFGGCNRCQMINLDPLTGQVQKLKEPLATLASFRRVGGNILFGILLRYEYHNKARGLKDGAKPMLQVGQSVHPY